MWNAHAPELWRRTVIGIRRHLDKLAKTHGTRVKLSYAKVGEFQRRGLIHFHAIFRLDGLDPIHPERTVPPHPAFTADVLADVIRQAANVTWFATVGHPARPKGWDIAWGAQVDPRVVRLTGDGEVTDVAVASYLAKYATKSTEAVGPLAVRITAGNLRLYGNPASHQGRLDPRRLAARQPPAPRLPGAAPLGTHARLPRPLRHQKPPLLHHHARPPRRPPELEPPPAPPRCAPRRRQTVITLTDLEWAGRGWRTTGDAVLALSAAARAREHRRVAREEAAVA